MSAWQVEPSTVVESMGAHSLYERICIAQPSVQAVLLLAEMRWKTAAHYAGTNPAEANKWNDLAIETLKSLTTDDSGEIVGEGILSNPLIDEVLIRTAVRFRHDQELHSTVVNGMQSWLTSIRGQQLDALNSC
jgi:hypothetical protein